MERGYIPSWSTLICPPFLYWVRGPGLYSLILVIYFLIALVLRLRHGHLYILHVRKTKIWRLSWNFRIDDRFKHGAGHYHSYYKFLLHWRVPSFTKQGLLPLPQIQNFAAVVFDSLMIYTEANTFSNVPLPLQHGQMVSFKTGTYIKLNHDFC